MDVGKMFMAIGFAVLFMGSVFVFSGCDNILDSNDNPVDKYEIGDAGLAGGIVFYVDEADEYEWNYLEVAPDSTEQTSDGWGDYETEIGGDAKLTGIGDGKSATDSIVEHMERKSISGTPAQLCDGLEHGHEGTIYDDWFLPSRDELYAMYTNLHKKELGGFVDNGCYWSSSESIVGSKAWGQYFADGLQINYDKRDYLQVRAIRAF